MESPVKSIVSLTRKDKANSQKYPLLILHSPTLHASLDSVLQAGPRFLDLPQSLLRFASLLRQLKTLTLLVFQRASQSKHSNDMFLTDSEYARLVHEKSVFHSYRFISLTSMYCADNREVVTEIIRSVVALQPKFVDDINTTLQAVLAIFRNIELKLQQWQLEEDHGTETSSDVNCIGRLDDVIDYLQDIGLTLDQFLSIVSQACPEVPKKCIADGLHTRFAHYCDSLTDLIRGQVLRNMRWSFEQKAQLLRKLSSAIAAMVKTVRCGIVEPGLLNPITQLAFSQDASDTSKRQGFLTAAAEFLQLLTEFTNHRNFACFYSLLYAIDEDINSIQEMAPSDALDPNVLEYVREAYSALSLDMKSQQANAVRTEKAPPPVSTLLHPQSEQSAEEPQAGSSRSNAFCTVKAVLPHAADDLIQRCLEHYKDDCQAVISGLLEGTVPLEVSNSEEARQHLEEQERRKGQQQQQQKPRQGDETATMNLAAAAATGVVTLQPGQIWKGKRQDAGGPALPPLSAQDRERVKQMAVSVWDDDDEDQAGYPAWWRNGEPGRAGGPNRFEDVNFDPYDDEYDDTYDLDVGATEHLTIDTDVAPPPKSRQAEPPPPPHNSQSEAASGKSRRGHYQRGRGGRGGGGRQTTAQPPQEKSRMQPPKAVASGRAGGDRGHLEPASNFVGSQRSPSTRTWTQQQQVPRQSYGDRNDVRLTMKSTSHSHDNIGEEDNEEKPTQRNTLPLEDPAVIRARREAAAEARASRRGRIVRTQPTDVPPQPLPRDGDFFPTSPEARKPWYAGPSGRPDQQPRGGARGRPSAARGGDFSRGRAAAPDSAGHPEAESSSRQKNRQHTAAGRLTPPPPAPASSLKRRGEITAYQAKLKERYGSHNQRVLADRKRQL
ncbi:hypothetical protein AAHC03_024432 [Spirometra sp. Aus1]